MVVLHWRLHFMLRAHISQESVTCPTQLGTEHTNKTQQISTLLQTILIETRSI